MAQPIEGAPGPDGKPGQPQPSIPPDPFENHGLVAGVAAIWMISKTGRDTRNENPAGFANVQAFWQAHQALAVPPPPPAPPPPPPIHGAVSWTGKLEDFPNLVPEILQGSGLPPQPRAVPHPQPPASGPGDMGSPAPVGPSPVQQASPIPPLPNGAPAGRSPLPVQ
jgi:hypothetical protein